MGCKVLMIFPSSYLRYCYCYSLSGLPLDISGYPGYELLSDKERDLASQLRIYPQQYLVIKDTLMRESLKHGHLKKAIARNLIKIGNNPSNTWL